MRFKCSPNTESIGLPHSSEQVCGKFIHVLKHMWMFKHIALPGCNERLYIRQLPKSGFQRRTLERLWFTLNSSAFLVGLSLFLRSSIGLLVRGSLPKASRKWYNSSCIAPLVTVFCAGGGQEGAQGAGGYFEGHQPSWASGQLLSYH